MTHQLSLASAFAFCIPLSGSLGFGQICSLLMQDCTPNSWSSFSFPSVTSLETRAFIVSMPNNLPNTAREKAVFPEEFSTSPLYCEIFCTWFNIPRAEIDLTFAKGRKFCILRKICTPSTKKGLRNAGSSTRGVICCSGLRNCFKLSAPAKTLCIGSLRRENKIWIYLLIQISKSLDYKILSNIFFV